MARVSLSQDGLHMLVDVPKETLDKMNEIRSRNPEEWKGRTIDLHIQAEKELLQEKEK